MARWKKAATGLVSLTVMGGLLAGCGTSGGGSTSSNGGSNTSGSSNTATNTTNTANTSNTSSNTSNTTAPADNVPSGQTITLWCWKADPWLTTVKKIAQAWAKQHGDTVKVVDQSKNPNGFQFYATAARTGKGPDLLFGMPHDNLGTFVKEGLIAPVPAGDINLSDYPTVAAKAVQLNGKAYAIPITIETTEIAYNKSMIPTPPTTWADFVKDANAHGFMYDQANLYDDFALVSGYGGYVFKDNNGTYDTKDIGLANAGAIKAFSLMHDMDAKYHWMTPSVNGSIAKTKFTNGKLGMYITGPWDISDIKKAGIKFGFAPWPTLANGQQAHPFSTVQTEIVNARNKDHEKAAWSLAKALADKDSEVKYCTEDLQIPALTAAENSPEIQSDPNYKAFLKEIQLAIPMPNIPEMQSVWGAASIIQNIISGKIDPATGAKDLVQNIKKGIKVANS